MMSKNSNLLGIVGDLHLGIKQNNKAFATFQRNYILDMLDHYNSIGVKSIIQLGDYVDNRKAISGELLHWLSTVFIPKLVEYNMTWIQLQGNHSQCLLNSNEITFDQVLEDLSKVYGNGNVKAITKPTDIVLEGLQICCVPWINKDTHDITVAHVEKSIANICVGHLEVEGVYLLKGSLTKSGHIDSNCFKKFDKVISGHIHTSSKIGNLFFAGSPYSLNWGEWEEPAVKGFYTLDTLTEELTLIPTPEQEIFTVLEYNYETIASQRLGNKYLDKEYLENTLHLRDKVIRIEVVDRANSSHYRSFLAAMRLVSCVNFTTLDLTREVETYEVDATPDKFNTDTLEVLLDKVEITEDIDNESVAIALKKIYSDVVDKNNLI